MRPLVKLEKPSRRRRVYAVTVVLRWQDDDGNEPVAHEIARDLAGTLNDAFRDFIKARKATLTTHVSTYSPIVRGK